VLNKRGDGPFLSGDVRRFERVMSRCATAIENALTYDELRVAEAGGAQLLVRSPKVLIADRDATSVGRVRELLEDDLIVLHAVDAAELLQTAEEEQPDIVLLNVAGDGRDGVTACKLLRSCPAVSETPIIVLAIGGMAIEHFLGRAPLQSVVGTCVEQDGRRILPLPHPSGVSRWLNDPQNQQLVTRALEILADVRHELNL
jgi:CheY-like chemotaxis protein